MLIAILVIIGLVIIWWIKSESDAQQKEIITRPAREAAAETERLRRQVKAEQLAAMTAQLEANAVIAQAIEDKRATFNASIFKPWNLSWNPEGVHLTWGIHIHTKSELNVLAGAWRSYLIRSNSGQVPRKWKDYAGRVKAQFNFSTIEKFGNPRTELEAIQVLERIRAAAIAAAIRAVTRYRHRQARKVKENVKH